MPPPAPVLLVIEDDPGIRDFLQLLLEGEGYTVETAADGRTGLARIAVGGIDLVLLDLMLPKLDGFEVCRRVRAQVGDSQLPILLLTALDSEEEQVAGFDAGADGYVTKPFRTEEVLIRVERLLRRPTGGEYSSQSGRWSSA